MKNTRKELSNVYQTDGNSITTTDRSIDLFIYTRYTTKL